MLSPETCLGTSYSQDVFQGLLYLLKQAILTPKSLFRLYNVDCDFLYGSGLQAYSRYHFTDFIAAILSEHGQCILNPWAGRVRLLYLAPEYRESCHFTFGMWASN